MDRDTKLRYYLSDAQADLKRGDIAGVKGQLEKALKLLTPIRKSTSNG